MLRTPAIGGKSAARSRISRGSRPADPDRAPDLMKIVSIGGGPAALYFALLRKKAHPDDEIRRRAQPARRDLRLGRRLLRRDARVLRGGRPARRTTRSRSASPTGTDIDIRLPGRGAPLRRPRLLRDRARRSCSLNILQDRCRRARRRSCASRPRSTISTRDRAPRRRRSRPRAPTA